MNLEERVGSVVADVFGVKTEVVLTRPDPQFGDFATSVALQLAKQLGKNPREVANELKTKLAAELKDVVAKVTVAGPGFINLRLTDKTLLGQLKEAAMAHELSRAGQVVVIETNNPNPFKAMHIGHAYNAIIADTLANLIDVSGAQLHRVSYHGDVGLHVGRSMYSLLRYVDGNVDKLNDIPKVERNSFMSKMYTEGTEAYKTDPKAKAAIDDLAKQSFSREDPHYAKVYDICKDWSFEDIDDIVKRLGNKPVERRFLESEADSLGVSIVQANVPKVFQESDGALVFPGSKHGSFDNVFVSNRGLGLYGARDLGLMKLKDDYCRPDQSYIVTAVEQKDYFIGVFAAAKLCLPDLKSETINIPTGTVKLPSGKMSSRTGDVVEISWLFDQVAQAVKARGGQTEDNFISAVLRYQFLKNRIGSDNVFDISEAISIEGNSGPYLQYAHARARSILAKARMSGQPTDLEAGERTLAAKLTEYPEVVTNAARELAPHLICTYLYELAQTFNRFYEQNRVIGDPRQDQRLYLVSKYADILKAGLGLLGIDAPEKM